MAITGLMRVGDILALLPESSRILAGYGLACAGCHFNAVETLEEGCAGHGLSEEETADLLTDLNEMLLAQPARQRTMTITSPAAVQLHAVLAAEGKGGSFLRVDVDPDGGFCMEIAETKKRGDTMFGHPAVPALRVIASAATLQGIGGSTIDFREGRFKLDLPEDLQKAACGCSATSSEACHC